MTLKSFTRFFILCLGIIAFYTFDSFATEKEKTQYDFELQSHDVFPIKDTHYTLKEITPIFHAILRPEVQVRFDAYFGLLFAHTSPPHKPQDLASGYQCLWSRIMAANTHNNPEDVLELQMRALHDSMGFHKPLIAKHDKTLAEKIPTLSVCPNCVMKFKSQPHGTKAYTTGQQS